MLSNMSSNCQAVPMSIHDDSRQYEERRRRNEGEDMQKAIAMLYEFKANLDKLHPNCVGIIENMLQRPRY